MQRCKALGSFCFRGGVGWHRSRCSGEHVAGGMGQAVATGYCASICHLHSHGPGPLRAPGPCAASLGDTHEAIPVRTASSTPQALAFLRDEELLRRGAVLPVSCKTPGRWLWGAAPASSRYKQDNPTAQLSSPLLRCLGCAQVPADLMLQPGQCRYLLWMEVILQGGSLRCCRNFSLCLRHTFAYFLIS